MNISHSIKESQLLIQLKQNPSISGILRILAVDQYRYDEFQKLCYQEKVEYKQKHKEPFPYSLFYMSPNAYCDPDLHPWFYKKVKRYGLKYRNVVEGYKILEKKFNIIKVCIGDRGDPEWRQKHLGTSDMNAHPSLSKSRKILAYRW